MSTSASRRRKPKPSDGPSSPPAIAASTPPRSCGARRPRSSRSSAPSSPSAIPTSSCGTSSTARRRSSALWAASPRCARRSESRSLCDASLLGHSWVFTASFPPSSNTLGHNARHEIEACLPPEPPFHVDVIWIVDERRRPSRSVLSGHGEVDCKAHRLLTPPLSVAPLVLLEARALL